MTAHRGLYDLILTDAITSFLASEPGAVGDLRALSTDEAAERLTALLGDQLRQVLDELETPKAERAHRQLDLINALLLHLRETYPSAADTTDLLDPRGQTLHAIHGIGEPAPVSPETGLAAPWLFTAGRGPPSLLSELRREAAACDRIDILVSFITLSGVRRLIDLLQSITAGDASGHGRTKVRVLTTTYTGATELAALDQLAALNGCEIRISLDGRRTRLHAKAWIFHRRTGFGSAYVGSANLSGAALAGGLEWTVKFTQRGELALYDRARAHFDTLWLDSEFTPYDHTDPANREAVARALGREKDGGDTGPIAFFDLQPKPFQREMLDQLTREREHGRHRNLLVAATGTGKTVVAALDYRNTVQQLGSRPRLLFVAHREQILRQALATYQQVLRDGAFGELLVGGRQPATYDHLFASIDSLTSRKLVESLGPPYWHTVVIDECHRLAADRFHALATTIQPAQLLGLTATPERSDGQPIAQYFSQRPDGSPAVELRLWDALDMQLLAPFEYYACDDATDFTDVPWGSQTREAAAIDALVTGNELRARTILNEWTRLTGDPRRGRTLVFCVSVAHAEFMTRKLNEAGIPALCVTGGTSRDDRQRALSKLTSNEVRALVTVDLYNEGVDIPEVETLLLLRPTQSPVLFQQQIGRGLRLSPGKESCLVLDFVGQHRADFRFDRLLSTITGLTRRELIDAVDQGFSGLPPGCHVHLQRQTREQVLHSLRSLAGQSWTRLTTELQAYAALRQQRDVLLGAFLHDQRVELDEVYRDARPSGWTTLRRSAGLLSGEGPEAEARLSHRFRDLLHVDDPEYLALIRRIAESPASWMPESVSDALRAQMLTYQVDTARTPLSYADWIGRLAALPECARELMELSTLLGARSSVDPRPIVGLEDTPLQLHAGYRSREILAAVNYHTAERRTPFQAGVLALRDRRTELLFVTLDKSEGFHDRIAYHDYAVSDRRFHWQTQNSVRPTTPTGRRYLESAENGWTFQLFVRSAKADPYRACGPVRLASPDDIGGDRPMNITWTLDVPLSPKMFSEFSVLRGQG